MEDIAFQNMDSWKGSGGSKFGLTFKQIILMHIHKTVNNGSFEWHGGYWNVKQNISGGAGYLEKIYVPNSRAVFNNSVRMLRALLLCYYDETMTKEDEEIMEKIDKIRNAKIREEDKEKLLELKEDETEGFIILFEELIKLSKRLNFFEEESGGEEI